MSSSAGRASPAWRSRASWPACGADVLLVDRYEIGERQTSACAVPEGWLAAMGAERSLRQELPGMTFTTPHGTRALPAAVELAGFDYRTLCEASARSRDARFETAKVSGRTGRRRAHRPRRRCTHRWSWTPSAGDGCSPAPRVPAARGAAQPRPRGAPPGERRGRRPRRLGRPLARPRAATAGACRRARRQRIGVGSYEPRHHVKRADRGLPRRLGADAVRCQGNWFPHRLRAATEDGVFFVRRQRGALLPAVAARASGRRSTSASPAGARSAACWRASARATQAWPATPPSARATARRSAARCASSASSPRCRRAC